MTASGGANMESLVANGGVSVGYCVGLIFVSETLHWALQWDSFMLCQV